MIANAVMADGVEFTTGDQAEKCIQIILWKPLVGLDGGNGQTSAAERSK